MQDRSVSAAGAIVYWSPAEHTDGAKLRAGLASAGFEQFAPEARPAEAVLRDALECVVASSTMLVRPLDKGIKGFVVVQESRGTNQGNVYSSMFDATIGQGGINFYCNGLSAEGWSLLAQHQNALQARYDALRDAFRPAQVSGCLVKILGALAGIRLRPQGAIYWLPQGVLPLWKSVTQAVEDAAFVGESARMYMVRTSMDEDTLRAVHDAIVSEAQQESTAIDTEVTEGHLGARALQNRVAAAKNLQTKIKLYEHILGQSLQDLSQSVERVEMAAAMAALSAAGSEE